MTGNLGNPGSPGGVSSHPGNWTYASTTAISPSNSILSGSFGQLNPTGTGAPSTVPTASNSQGTYTNLGLYNDTPSGTVLTGKTTQITSLTVGGCASACLGYQYFGVENGSYELISE